VRIRGALHADRVVLELALLTVEVDDLIVDDRRT
jgi:hypothetical protein